MRTLPEKAILRGVPYAIADLPASCVPACLTMVCRYLRPDDQRLTLHRFADRLGTGPQRGAYFVDAVAAARELGFRGRLVTASPGSRRAFNQIRYCIGALNLPLIVGINGGKGAHAAVLVGYDNSDVLIRDPGGAWHGTTMRWSWASFQSCWQPSRPVVWIATGPIDSPF